MRQFIVLASLLSALSGCAAVTPPPPSAPIANNSEPDDGYCFQLIVCPLIGAVDFASE